MKWIHGILSNEEEEHLRKTYKKAIKEQNETFIWNGGKYYTRFIYYVLRFIDKEKKPN